MIMAMRADSELMVITKAKDLITYLFQISENAPKKFRFTLISKMQNSALNVLEDLILANAGLPVLSSSPKGLTVVTYDDLFTFENLYDAFLKASKCKRNKKDVIQFELNLSGSLPVYVDNNKK